MRRSLTSRAHGGPLMTDHLQLQDLDLELELLKRKREMIERQQQIVSSNTSYNRPRPFDYGNVPQKPFSGLPQHNIAPLFSHYDKPESSGYGGGSLLGKRPMNDQPWIGHSTPKRYSMPLGGPGPKRKFISGPGPKPNPPRNEPPRHQMAHQSRPQWSNPQPPKGPKSNYPSQRFNNQKNTKPVNKDFRPTKVTKPRPPTAPNKLASVPTPERAKLVKQSIGQIHKGPQTESEQNMVLRDDQVPSQKLAGRLELALGSILKDIKTKYSGVEPHAASFQSVFLQHQMKQAIRERLRSVMMGKYVGKATDIVEQYRKVFPVDTDTEILQIALDCQEAPQMKKLAIKLENAGSTYNYIKVNLNRLVSVTLDEILGKVKTLCEEDDSEIKDICKKILGAEVPNIKKVAPEKPKEDGGNTSNASIDTEPNNEVQATPDVELVEGEAQDETNKGESEQPEESADQEQSVAGENKDQNAGESAVKDKEQDVDDAATKLDNLVVSLLRRRLPHILPRFKSLLTKILNVTGSYQITKDAILLKAQEKQKIDRRVADAQKNGIEIDETATNAKPSTPIVSPSPYMVKILGRPILPKRKLMQDFLNIYKPSSVKKHRKMHLLFVSFKNKEDFEKILAVKETTIGTSTVYIKVNERVTLKSDDTLNTTAESQDDSADNSIASLPTELDEQINNLLSSIREEAETDEGNTETADGNIADGSAANGDDNAVIADDKPQVNGSVNTEQTNDVVIKSEDTSDETNNAHTDELKTEAKVKVEDLKNEVKDSGRATPTRASTRLANVTPSSVKTRRASRLLN